MVSSSQTNRFEFSGFRLDRRRRLLTDPSGNPVTLTAKAFDTLVYFLEHSGQVVSRSALLESLWPDTVVEENNLSQAVVALRRALGEGFIITVPRRGYQFVANVRPIGEAVADAEPVADAPTPVIREALPTSGAGRPTKYLAAAAVLFVAGAAFAITYTGMWPRAGGGDAEVAADLPSESQPMVAVLPCENLSPDPDDAYFSAGIHEEILNQLTKLSGLRVIARTSVMQYAGNRPPIPQIARELDATAILECSVRYAGRDILVTAQLIDPRTNAHIWSNTYPGNLSELQGVFAMQADIATSIARVLDAELSPVEARRLETLPTSSPEAYVAFLKGLEEVPTEGVSHFSRAIELDANFGLAYAWRGLSHLARALEAIESGRSPFNSVEEVGLAVADADRALAIDSNIGLAHIVACARYLETGMDDASIESSVARALALSPNHGPVLFIAAGWYLSELRPEEARALLERMSQIDPNAGSDPLSQPFAEFLFLSGDLDGVAEYHRRYVDRNPTDVRGRHRLAFHEALRGKADEAGRELAIAEQLLADTPQNGVYVLGYLPVYTYGLIGRPDAARRTFDRFVAPVSDDRLLPMMHVLAHLGVGEVERAHEWAAKVPAPPVPWPGAELWLILNPMNDPVLDRPEFLELRRKLGYRDQRAGARRP